MLAQASIELLFFCGFDTEMLADASGGASIDTQLRTRGKLGNENDRHIVSRWVMRRKKGVEVEGEI